MPLTTRHKVRGELHELKAHSPQHLSHFRHQLQVSQSPGPPSLQTSWLQIPGIPRTTFRFDNLLEQLTELRKALYLMLQPWDIHTHTHTCIAWKGTNWKQLKEVMYRGRVQKGCKGFIVRFGFVWGDLRNVQGSQALVWIGCCQKARAALWLGVFVLTSIW